MMLTILSTLSQVFLRRILALSLMALLSLSGLVIFSCVPAYATTLEEQQLIPPDYKPTPEERIERAYEQSEATGFLEEMKQKSCNADKYFDPTKKANMRTIIKQSKAEDSQQGLVEKAKELVEKVTK